MREDKLNWCIKQKRGVELIKCNNSLSNSYLEKANYTLLGIPKAVGEWKSIMAYYACYNALYSILMKAGIKCEIHDCTIALMDIIGFSSEEILFINKLKKNRIDAQYYLKEIEFQDLNEVKAFILKCNKILNSINEEKIKELRNKIR